MKGFYKIPNKAVGGYIYGDMTGHRIDVIGIIAGDTYYFVSDDECPIPVPGIPEPGDETPPEFEYVTLTAEQAAYLKPQAAGDIRDMVFPDPDVRGLAEAIWVDELLLPVSLQLVSFQQLIKDYLPEGESGVTRIQEGWQRFKPQLDAITPAFAARVEELAVQFRVPIV